ncbi:hypothetical protein Aperf_G00000076515 [Anoplocephala perfoliata]
MDSGYTLFYSPVQRLATLTTISDITTRTFNGSNTHYPDENFRFYLSWKSVTPIPTHMNYGLLHLQVPAYLHWHSDRGKSLSPPLSVGISLMRSLERLLDSALVRYNTSSNRGQVFTPRSDDPENRTRRSHQRTRNHDTTITEIDRIRDLILRQIFDLLANLAWYGEALGFFAKAKILSHFTALDAKALARVPKAQYLQRLWLQFLTNLTFTREGQTLLLNYPGAVSVLVDHVRYCRNPVNRQAALLCLQNLCANTSFKTYLYQGSCGIVKLLADALEPSKNSSGIILQALTALSNAAYNCTKFRSLLKGEGFVQRLNNLKTYCQTNSDDRLHSLLPSVELLLNALAGGRHEILPKLDLRMITSTTISPPSSAFLSSVSLQLE